MIEVREHDNRLAVGLLDRPPAKVMAPSAGAAPDDGEHYGRVERHQRRTQPLLHQRRPNLVGVALPRVQRQPRVGEKFGAELLELEPAELIEAVRVCSGRVAIVHASQGLREDSNLCARGRSPVLCPAELRRQVRCGRKDSNLHLGFLRPVRLPCCATPACGPHQRHGPLLTRHRAA
jgi:hypothetical protein